MIRILSILAMMFLFVGVHNAAAAKRVALVIGNSAYEHAPELINPKNDAADMSARLKELDFEVFEGIDVNLRDLLEKIQDFADQLEGADVAAFYYAGHGLQVKGQNYLVPVDAELKSHITLDYEAVPINLVLASMQERVETNLLFLDACRDNPLARSLARSMGTRSSAIGQGLARVGAGRGTMVAFATEPGNVALDGTGENSPYTTALVKHLGTPGESLSDSMIRVRREVMQSTNGRQVPWEHSSLTGRVVLKEKPKIIEPPKPDRGPEIAYWNSIKNLEDRNFFEAYLAQFPKGIFVDLAKLKISSIEKRLAEEQAAIEAAKAASERKAAEEAKRAEEQRMAAIEADRAKQALEAREAEERLAAEETRQAELAARKEAERLKAETAAQLKAAEESRKAAEVARLAAEERLAELETAKKQREADEARRQKEMAAAAEKTPKQNEQQMASLEQPATEQEIEEVKSDPKKDRELVRSIQTELNRVGCSAGKADGIWGRNTSRAIGIYAKHGKTEMASLEPSTELLDSIKTQKARICPLVCGNNQQKINGRCIQKKSVQQKEIITDKKSKPKTIEKVGGKDMRTVVGPANDCYVCKGKFTVRMYCLKPGQVLGQIYHGSISNCVRQ